MRAEKQYLVEEVGRWVDSSNYLLLVQFTGFTVADTANLRSLLREHQAEFHVVKNTILDVAAKARGIESMESLLNGQNGIIVGGKDVAVVAKAVSKWIKDNNKGEIKGGHFQKKLIKPEDVVTLCDLPPAPVLQAKLLGLLNTPASSLVRALSGVPQALLNVLDARAKKAA